MKPELEYISLKNSEQSYRFFKQSETVFVPYWHYHPEIELTLITKGKGTRFVGDSISSFSELDLVLIGENLPHHWVSTSPERNQEAYVFQFNKSLFSDFVEFKPFNKLIETAKFGVHYHSPNSQLIHKITEFENLNSLIKLSTLIEIIHLLLTDTNTNLLATKNYLSHSPISRQQSKISKTTNYILEHLDEKLTVNRMAEFTHMVPQSFCRWFKKHSGHSFVSFLNQTRIERVCQLLATSDNSIQNIAFSCGFESLSHFNRTFKSIKECSPRTFRKTKLS